MSESAALISRQQDQWASTLPRDHHHTHYLPAILDNVFERRLHPETRADFDRGDGSELHDSEFRTGKNRPAKMRALASSSALAVNFFDAWRDADKAALSSALGLPAPIAKLQFEFKPDLYPVKPRSPNLDLLLELADGRLVGVESKFAEPYRSATGHRTLSPRYLPEGQRLWMEAGLPGAQALADTLSPDWKHLDAPQLLKHMLGLASMRTPRRADSLLYLWFDTDRDDARNHAAEVDCFASHVAGDAVHFLNVTYQQAFARLGNIEPRPGWWEYVEGRYLRANSAQ
ncbi:MAG: hypothetical protein IPK85_00320 [Gemmatimonadetes bacterium]|nr:hypothetical protein [Gemmatimonadota bacterium]